MYTRKVVREILKEVERGKLSSKHAFRRLQNLPYETFGYARIDHHRSFRKGFPEAVYAPGKTPAQLERIVASIKKSGQNLIITRLESEAWKGLHKKFSYLKYSEEARLAYSKKKRVPLGKGKPVAVISAGTSDQPVAEEARLALEIIGQKVLPVYDCGVSGLHRLMDQLPKLKKCKAVICVAGMDGALPSVVGGLIDRPVIAVPTSVGYGAHYRGIAPLLTMLNTCSQGVAVMNIDNGFGAACFASLIT